MPSPFPGMDPFLEQPSLFHSVHFCFPVYLSEALQGRLPTPYFAEINERLWVDNSQLSIEPDVVVLHNGQPDKVSDRSESERAVLTRPDQPILITVPLEEHRQTCLQICTLVNGRERAVAIIEVLSPSNKAAGSKSRTLYLNNQQDILASDSHLIEIDLLRGGTHTTAVPLHWLHRKAPPYAYHVCVHAFDLPETFAVYTIQLAERLPSIAIPLLPGDGNVTVDLQAVFQRCYDTGPYRRRVRYDPTRIEPPLTPEQLAWVTQLLKTQGLPDGPAPATNPVAPPS